MMIHVDVTFDPAKREATLRHRGLDFADAALVLEGVTFDREDRRFDYGEIRVVSVGMLRGRGGGPRLDRSRGYASHHFDAECDQG